MLSSIFNHIWTPKATQNETCFEPFLFTLSGQVFESIGPPFRELLAINFDTLWDQRGKVKTVLSLQSEPS